MKITGEGGKRIALVDVARGAALVAMAVYHFAWDLEFFGYVAPGMTAEGGWKLSARAIASTFLFLVGFSLVLAHGGGVRWRGFWRRWLMVGASAAVITILTRFAFPDSYIFFGILHQIAFASLFGLAFLRLPWPLVLAAALVFIAAPHVAQHSVFDAPLLLWTGLSVHLPRSNDYVPVFPWTGAVLAGIASAQLARGSGLTARLAAVESPRWTALLGLAGRHSLAFYLVHQPLLIACVWVFSQAYPADRGTPQEQFVVLCERSCLPVRDQAFCEAYCGCALDRLVVEDRLDDALGDGQNDETRSWLGQLAEQCTLQVELSLEEGGAP